MWMSPVLVAVFQAATLNLWIASATTAAQNNRYPERLQWLGLFSEPMIAWLENENRMAELCKQSPGSEEAVRCREEKLRPQVIVITARNSPRQDGRIVGTIVLVATPGSGLRAYSSRGGAGVPFLPDMFDNDWGYGPYFHQTILARTSTWFRLPVTGFVDPVWVDAREWTDQPNVIAIEPGRIISTPLGDMMTLEVANRMLRARPEQPSDMPCDVDVLPQQEPYTEVRIPFDRLFDRAGHLLVRVKYTRGC